MTNPTNPNPGTAGSAGSAGSAVEEQRNHPPLAADTTSPWRHPEATSAAAGPAVQAAPGEDTATTTSMPAIGGPNDPYANGQAPNGQPPNPAGNGQAPSRPAASRPPASPPAARPVPAPAAPPPAPVQPRPRSAIDQYAAMNPTPGVPPVVPHAGATMPTAIPPSVGPGPARRVPGPAAAPGMPAGAVAAGMAGGAAVAAPPVPKVRPATAIRKPKAGATRSPRRAKLQVRHLNVWSVLRFSCVLAIALFFVWLIMVGVLYGILDVTHVFDKVNQTVRDINGDNNSKNAITPGVVFGGAFVIGLVNIVLFIALSTIGSIVYNLCADLVGGVEVTLAEHE